MDMLVTSLLRITGFETNQDMIVTGITELDFDIAGETIACRSDINVRTPTGAPKLMLVVSEDKRNSAGVAKQRDAVAQGVAELLAAEHNNLLQLLSSRIISKSASSSTSNTLQEPATKQAKLTHEPNIPVFLLVVTGGRFRFFKCAATTSQIETLVETGKCEGIQIQTLKFENMSNLHISNPRERFEILSILTAIRRICHDALQLYTARYIHV